MHSTRLEYWIVLAMLFLTPAVVGPAPLRLSREQGDRLARKIEGINKNAVAQPVRSKQTTMTDSEINSYLAFNIKDKIPPGLAHPEIHTIGNNQLTGRVFVDMDEFNRGRASSGMMDPLSYISGQVPFTARGALLARNGEGKFQLISAEIHGVPLPRRIVQELVSFFSRTPERPNGFNLDEPFALPAKIREIAIGEGETVVAQ